MIVSIIFALAIGGILASFMFGSPKTETPVLSSIPRGPRVPKKKTLTIKEVNDVWKEAAVRAANDEADLKAHIQAVKQQQFLKEQQQRSAAQAQQQMPRFDDSGMSLQQYQAALQAQAGQRQDLRRSQNRDLSAKQFMEMVNPKWGRRDD